MNIKIDIDFSVDEAIQMFSGSTSNRAIKTIADGLKRISEELKKITDEEPSYDFAFTDDDFRPEAIESAEPEQHWLFDKTEPTEPFVITEAPIAPEAEPLNEVVTTKTTPLV